MALTINWPGASGLEYSSQLYGIEQEFNPVPGVYIACYEYAGSWYAVYVGETTSFHQRLNLGRGNHEGLKRALASGATHIAAFVVNDPTERLRIETDLRHGLDPIANRQSVPEYGFASLTYR